MATALAATIGTGNIIGVATAIALGGPGAVLWCWFTGVFGIATKYAESLLSVKYRMKNERGQMVGGPMYVLEKGLKMKWLGVLFAIFTVFATFGIGSTVQVNSIALLANETFGLPFHVTGLNDKDFYDNYVADLIYEMNLKHDKVRLEIMHPHNVILETWTQLGLIGVILLLACWILPFTMKLGREQFYLNLCVFAFLLQAQFESMGNNLQPMYFCLIVLLFHSHVLGRRAERISLHH